MRDPSNDQANRDAGQEGKKVSKIKLLFAPSDIFGPFGLAGSLLCGILGGLVGGILGKLLFGG